MGTPAFGNLGKHCNKEDCKQIDFLPFSCDSCHKVFCLEHRSYFQHQCPIGNKNDVQVVICPLCAKGVRLIPEEDPNITWESHVNTECDPSNYEKTTKKKKCPVKGCREHLTFSNTIKCRDCSIDHCLKHRFGADHTCPGPKKPEPGFQLMSFLNKNKQEEQKPNRAQPSSSSSSSSIWSSNNWLTAASKLLSGESSQKVQTGQKSSGSGNGNGNGSNNQVEQCPQCRARFSSVTALVDHVEKIHEKKGLMKVTIDVCPKCSKGFRDPVALVEHVEKEHRGTSKV